MAPRHSVAVAGIIEEKNYYPFGLIHKGYNFNINGIQNSYLTYNGKEFDMSLNMDMYDLGARMMDPALGRFMNIDPMADFVNYQSPYVVADNNPVAFIDLYGLGKKDKCGFFCRLVNRLLFGKDNLVKEGARKGRRDNVSRSTGWDAYVYGKQKDDDCTDCGTTGTTRPPINLSGFETSIAGVQVPNFGPAFAEARKPIPRFDGDKIEGKKTIYPDLEFSGKDGNTLDPKLNLNNRTLNALIKTLKDHPQIRLFMYINRFREAGASVTNEKAAEKERRASIFKRARSIIDFLKGKGVDVINRIDWGIDPTREIPRSGSRARANQQRFILIDDEKKE